MRLRSMTGHTSLTRLRSMVGHRSHKCLSDKTGNGPSLCVTLFLVTITMCASVSGTVDCGDTGVWPLWSDGTQAGWATCYHVSNHTASWEDARSTCQNMSADMLTLTNMDEHDVIITILDKTHQYFVGYHLDNATAAQLGEIRDRRPLFKWVDDTVWDEDLSFIWLPTAPEIGDQCVKYRWYVAQPPERWTWFGETCDQQLRFICEKKVQVLLTSTETPTTQTEGGGRTQPSTDGGEDFPTAIVAGVLAGIAVLIVLLLLIVCIVYKKNKRAAADASASNGGLGGDPSKHFNYIYSGPEGSDIKEEDEPYEGLSMEESLGSDRKSHVMFVQND